MFKVFDTFLGAPARDWSGEMLAMQRADDAREQGNQNAQNQRVEGTTPSLSLDKYAGTFADPDSLYPPITISSENGGVAVPARYHTGGHDRALAARHLPGRLGRLVAGAVDHHVHHHA